MLIYLCSSEDFDVEYEDFEIPKPLSKHKIAILLSDSDSEEKSAKINSNYNLHSVDNREFFCIQRHFCDMEENGRQNNTQSQF